MTEYLPELNDKRGQTGTWGQPVMTRVCAPPDALGVLGTGGNTVTGLSQQSKLVVSAGQICPHVSPACPQDKIISPPYAASVSPASPVAPSDITAVHLQAVNIIKLCRLLKIDPVLLHSQGVLDVTDAEIIAAGGYTATQIISCLLGWQAVGYTAPFAVLEKTAMRQKLSELGVAWPNGEHLDEWLSLSE